MSRSLGALLSIIGTVSILFSVMTKNGVFTGETALAVDKLQGDIGGYLGEIGISMGVLDFLLYGGIALGAIGLIFMVACRKR